MIFYAISDPSILHFDWRLSGDLKRIADRADWLLYRDKDNPNYAENAYKLFEETERNPHLRLLLHDDWKLARDLGGGGVHFSGHGASELEQAKSEGIFTIVSTHSIEEALRFAKAGVDAVTLSPIFSSPGKGRPLGSRYLHQAVALVPIPVIALGGVVSQERIDEVRRSGAAGFASIRYFG